MAPPLYPTHTLHLNTLSLSFPFSPSFPSFFLCIVFFFGIFIFLSSSFSFAILSFFIFFFISKKKKFLFLPPYLSIKLVLSSNLKKDFSLPSLHDSIHSHSETLSHGSDKHSMVAVAWVLGWFVFCQMGFLVFYFELILSWVCDDFSLILGWLCLD